MENDEVDVYVFSSEDKEVVGLRVGEAIALLDNEQARNIATALLEVVQINTEGKDLH